MMKTVDRKPNKSYLTDNILHPYNRAIARSKSFRSKGSIAIISV